MVIACLLNTSHAPAPCPQQVMLTAGVALIQMPDSSACVHAMQTKDRDTCSHCPFCLLSCLPACLHVCVCVCMCVCVCVRARSPPPQMTCCTSLTCTLRSASVFFILVGHGLMWMCRRRRPQLWRAAFWLDHGHLRLLLLR